MSKVKTRDMRAADETERRAVEMEQQATSEMAAIAAVLLVDGGECDCGEYGLFRVTMTDGRVFKKAGLHGSGGLYRLDISSTAAAALVHLNQAIEVLRRDLEEKSPTNFVLMAQGYMDEVAKIEGDIARARQKLIARVHHMVEFKRTNHEHRSVVIYLAHRFCGSEVLSATPELVASIELESAA